MTESVIVTGSDLTVVRDGQVLDRDELVADLHADPKRKRRPDYVAPPPSDIDLGALIEALGRHNPWWSDEANADAEAHPEIRPKDMARKWCGHQITAQEAA